MMNEYNHIFITYGILGFFVLIAYVFSPPVVPVCNVQENDMVAFDIGQGTTGSFFLGIGGIGDEQYYYSIIKESDGALKFTKDDASRAKVYEGNYTPRRIFYSGDLFKTSNCSYYGVVFYVPEGTIKRVMNIDISKLR